MLACAKIGATLVEFKQTRTSREFSAFMDLFRPRMIMIPTLLGKTNYYEMMRYELVPELQIGMLFFQLHTNLFIPTKYTIIIISFNTQTLLKILLYTYIQTHLYTFKNFVFTPFFIP